jgi:hypothetical protein
LCSSKINFSIGSDSSISVIAPGALNAIRGGNLHPIFGAHFNRRFNFIKRDSFAPQRHQWINIRRPPRWQVAGNQRHYSQQRCHYAVDQRVIRLDAIKHL